MSETSSSEPGFLKLLGLVAMTLCAAFVAVAGVIVILCAITPEAPQKAAEAAPRATVSLPHVSRVKPLLTHLKRLHKPVKRRRARR
jgi:hypothetical protein